MAGSIRLKRKPDIWDLRTLIGRDNQEPVRHRQFTFRGTRRRAELELARLIVKQSETPTAIAGGPTRWGPTTVNDAIQAWKDNGWDDLSPKTVRGYENTLTCPMFAYSFSC